MSELKKIVVIGPESTGKSTLCELLALHYNTLWCPEYAREYLLTHGIHYTYDDLLTIAKGQLALEEEYVVKSEKLRVKTGEEGEHQTAGVKRETTEIKSVSFNQSAIELQSAPKESIRTIRNRQSAIDVLFIDTDMYVMKVWSEYVFKKCDPFIDEQIASRKYNLYLHCDIDLPWEADVLREYPDEERRRELYEIYKSLLSNQQTPWVEISGNYEERLQKAINAVDTFFGK